MSARSLHRVVAAATSAALLTGAGLFAAAPASAHATVQLYGSTPAAGGYGAMWIRIGHGCDGSPTKKVEVTVPSTFGSAKPQQIAGWTSRVALRTDGSRLVTWMLKKGGAPLRDDEFADFGISVKYPATEGTYMVPTVQRCLVGAIAWNEEGHDSEHPAPTVTVGPGSGGGH